MNKFKVGDKVYCNYHNLEGVVEESYYYGVCVRFLNNRVEMYNNKGYINESTKKGIHLLSKDPEIKLHLLENDSYTDFAHSLDFETGRAVRQIFKNYMKLGYSIREIEYVMSNAIRDLALANLLNWE